MRRRLLALLALAPATARAHSELRGSSPADGAVLEAPPTRLELRFNETVQVTLLRLRREDGVEMPLPARSIRERREEIVALPPLPAGAYVAEWRAISSDGHAIGGALRFRVGGP